MPGMRMASCSSWRTCRSPTAPRAGSPVRRTMGASEVHAMQALKSFIDRVRPLPRLVIQAHDFPDHDAVSSSYALAHLVGQFGVKTQIVYNGVIDRISLKNLIDQLRIPIVHWTEANLVAGDKTIT